MQNKILNLAIGGLLVLSVCLDAKAQEKKVVLEEGELMEKLEDLSQEELKELNQKNGIQIKKEVKEAGDKAKESRELEAIEESVERETLGYSNYSNLITNGDFEQGTTGWYGDTQTIVSGASAYSGSNYAYIGGNGLFQALYTYASLKGTTTASQFKYFYKYVDDPAKDGGSGGLLIMDAYTLEVIGGDVLDDDDDKPDWWYVEFDFASLAGRDLMLSFVMDNNDDDGTTYNNRLAIDKITLSATILDSSPIHRFWSNSYTHHFYTIDGKEKNSIVDNWPDVWGYEGEAFFGYTTQINSLKPVHRFWSDTFMGHFYTISEEEKNMVQAEWSDIWTYEGVAYYAFSSYQAGSKPLYRFWSDQYVGHFYTTSVEEKDNIIANWPDIWTYEGVAYFVD
jgi:hypothetical protein